jgi:hypothetical protein
LAVAQLTDRGRHAGLGKRGCLLGAVTAIACGLTTAVSAEVHVEGNLSALRLTAGGDALSDVLSAFGRLSSPVTTRTSVPLNDEISGAYSGSLSRVVSRLLDGYNYVIKQDSGVTEIIVFGRRGEAAVAPRALAPAARNALSRWR